MPLISVVVGEGGSGGAIALAVADRVLMLEHAIYSVISPEGCAAILWRASDKASEAADALKLTAQDLLELRLIDAIVEEPTGGAHRGRSTTIGRVGDAIEKHLNEIDGVDGADVRRNRREKFIRMGQPVET